MFLKAGLIKLVGEIIKERAYDINMEGKTPEDLGPRGSPCCMARGFFAHWQDAYLFIHIPNKFPYAHMGIDNPY